MDVVSIEVVQEIIYAEFNGCVTNDVTWSDDVIIFDSA